MLRLLCLFVLWHVGMYPCLAAGMDASTWQILSPRPSQVVPSADVVIAAAVTDGALDPARVEILLDGQARGREAVVSERRISLVPSRLTDGVHEVTIRAWLQDGTALPPLSWRFSVGASADPSGPVYRRASPFILEGSSVLSTRGSSLSGAGRALRQEPPGTHAADVDLVGRYGSLEFPLRLYLTSDAETSLQPRNRLLVGVRAPLGMLLVGDTSPRFGRLAYSGARLRGAHGEAHVRWLHVHAAYGELRRGLASRLLGALPVDDPGGIPTDDPVSLLVPGTYRRTMAAGRIAFGHERSVIGGLHVLRATDHMGAIDVGQDPQQNLVGGGDLQAQLWRQRIRLNAGAALSVLTLDAARGPITKAEADSLLGLTLPLDPARFRRLIVLNGSTIPLRPQQSPSAMAWYAEGDARLGTHHVHASVESIGSAFFSLANPFLQNDRQRFELADRFRLFEGRIGGTLSYRHEATPPRSDDTFPTLSSDVLAGQFTVAPRRGPRLLLGARLHQRDRQPAGTSATLRTRLRSYSLGGYQAVRTGGVRHNLNLFWTRTNRDERDRPEADNTTTSLSGGLVQQFPIPLDLSLQATHLTIDSEALGRLQRLTTLGGRLGYTRAALRLGLAAQNIHTAATLYASASDRMRLSADARYRILDRMTLELELGLGTYREDGAPANRYEERYVLLRHRYRF